MDLTDERGFARSGPWFNIKMLSYQYRESHRGDKTVVRSSYLHNGISYTGKMTFLYWFSPLSLRFVLNGPAPHTHGLKARSMFANIMNVTSIDQYPVPNKTINVIKIHHRSMNEMRSLNMLWVSAAYNVIQIENQGLYWLCGKTL